MSDHRLFSVFLYVKVRVFYIAPFAWLISDRPSQRTIRGCPSTEHKFVFSRLAGVGEREHSSSVFSSFVVFDPIRYTEGHSAACTHIKPSIYHRPPPQLSSPFAPLRLLQYGLLVAPSLELPGFPQELHLPNLLRHRGDRKSQLLTSCLT